MCALGGVLKGRDILCFSERWDGDPLSAAHVMKRLARHNRVLWIESIGRADVGRTLRTLTHAVQGVRERHPNLWVLTPLAIPFAAGDLVRAANAALLKRQILRAIEDLDLRDPISWSFVPGGAPIAGTLGEALVVYHCVDELAAKAASEPQLERRLLLNADVVICSSAALRSDKARMNANTHLVRHGVDLDHFARAFAPETTVPPDIRGEPGPVIGMWGRLGGSLDADLIRYVADAFSGGTVVLLGEPSPELEALQRARNVRILGRPSYAELPRYAKAFDIALMPFRVDQRTASVNPPELREYLAAGLPVVSTAIPELDRLGLCRIGRTPDEIVRHISAAIAAGPGPTAQRAAHVKGESWEARTAEMEQIVAAALARRRAA